MTTRQPRWNTIYNTDYSRLLEDLSGVYDGELEIAQEVDDAPTKERFILYRFSLPQLEVVRNGRLVTKNIAESDRRGTLPHHISQYEEWFEKDLAKAANSIGVDRAYLVRLLTSSDLRDRAEAYEIIGGYHGFDNFDSYPLTLSVAGLNKRWG